MARPSARVTGLLTVGALAVGCWLPGYPAAAQTLAETYETTANPPLAWLAPTAGASIAADGVNSTVQLSVYGASDVTQVEFSYRASQSDAWTVIGTATRSADAFSIEWAPPASSGSNYDLRAVPAVPASGGLLDGRGVTRTVSWSSTAPAVQLGSGSVLPFYRQEGSGADAGKQYVAVSGTVSASTPDEAGSPGTDTTVALSSPNFPSASPVNVTVPYSSGSTARPWSGVLVIPGNDAIGTPGNSRLVLHAGSTSGAGSTGGDAAAIYSLVEQQVGAVTAVPQQKTVQVESCWLLGCTTTTKTIDVLQGLVVDATPRRHPVAGVRIRAVKVGDSSVTVTSVRTGADGLFTLENAASSSDGDLPSGQFRVFADLGDDGELTNGVDPSTLTTVGTSSPSPAVLRVTSLDGAAFDTTESAAHDLYVDVIDQKGDATAATVSYEWSATYADGRTESFPASSAATVNSPQGRAFIPRPSDADGAYTLATWVDLNSSGGPDSGDAQSLPLALAWGQARLAVHGGKSIYAVAGTETVAVRGKLTLWDGTPLPGRTVAVVYSGSTAYVPTGGTPPSYSQQPGDSRFATWQPSGATWVSGSQISATTNSFGSFELTLTDPAVAPQYEERGGAIAATAATLGAGTAADPPVASTVPVSWIADPSTLGFHLADNAGGTRQVGRTVTVTAKVVDQFGQGYPGVKVAFSRSGSAGADGSKVSTDATGSATYAYTSKAGGTTTVRAVFLGPDGSVWKTLSDTVTWVVPIKITATLAGSNTATGADRLKVAASSRKARGAAVKVFALAANGKLVKVATGRLNRRGVALFTVTDVNGAAVSNYVAKIASTLHTRATHTNWVTLG